MQDKTRDVALSEDQVRHRIHNMLRTFARHMVHRMVDEQLHEKNGGDTAATNDIDEQSTLR